MAIFWRAQALWLIALISGACQTGSGPSGPATLGEWQKLHLHSSTSAMPASTWS